MFVAKLNLLVVNSPAKPNPQLEGGILYFICFTLRQQVRVKIHRKKLFTLLFHSEKAPALLSYQPGNDAE